MGYICGCRFHLCASVSGPQSVQRQSRGLTFLSCRSKPSAASLGFYLRIITMATHKWLSQLLGF